MPILRVKYLSFFFLLISLFSFLNIIYSYYFNLYLNLDTYYYSLIISGLIGFLFYKIDNFKFLVLKKNKVIPNINGIIKEGK